MGIRTLLSWSSGKDSAWTLHTLRQQGAHEVVGLVTTVNSAYNRVAMHGTRASLLRAQAAAAGLPLIELPLPWPCSNQQYEAVMRDACAAAVADDVEAMAFGDLYLEDVRRYREERLAGTGITPVFPLWGRDTRALVREMLDGGLRARLTCVDPRKVPAGFAGRELDASLLAELPPGTDPCAENGEFHTCAYAGPMFANPIALSPGAVEQHGDFVFADFIPE
ncbi:MAG TPA: ATP-binding protein [Acidobacteriaceae bacterium]